MVQWDHRGLWVPLFLFQGESDVVTLTSLATEYFEEVEAPTKGLALLPAGGALAASRWYWARITPTPLASMNNLAAVRRKWSAVARA